MAIPSASDRLIAEKKTARTATTAVRAGLRFAIDRTTYRKKGLALSQASSRAVFKDNRLQRITLRAPHYIFKQHYGFEGTKSNGIMMRLRATNVLNIAVEKANILDQLADEISQIRLDEVTARIQFTR